MGKEDPVGLDTSLIFAVRYVRDCMGKEDPVGLVAGTGAYVRKNHHHGLVSPSSYIGSRVEIHAVIFLISKYLYLVLIV